MEIVCLLLLIFADFCGTAMVVCFLQVGGTREGIIELVITA